MMKRFKRIFEVLSVICSTASVSIVIACLYDGIPDILGYKSQEMLFDFAFSLLVVSVISYALAMTSRIQEIKMKIYFPTPRILKPISKFLTLLFNFKNKEIVCCKKVSKPVNNQPVFSHGKSIENSKDKRGNQEYSNSLESLSAKNNADAEYTFKNTEKNTVFPQPREESSGIENITELQVRHSSIIFGHRSVAHGPNFIKSRKLMPFDLQRMDKKSQLIPHILQTFNTNGHFNEVNARNISNKHAKVGIVSPMEVNDSIDVTPSVEGIHSCQNFAKRSFNPRNLLEHQGIPQTTVRTPNACFKVGNNIPYESNVSGNYFLKLPNNQKEAINNRLHMAVRLQQVANISRHGSHETSYPEPQTMPEMSDNFSNEISRIGRFSSHDLQEVNSGNHCFKLHRRDTQNFKNFKNPLRKFNETPHSKIEQNNIHYGWNINSRDWGEKFVERPDTPMEISNSAPNDQVLEVSMKLKDLNFIF